MKKLFCFCVIIAFLNMPVFSATTFDLTATGNYDEYAVGMSGTGVVDSFLQIFNTPKSVAEGYNINFASEYDEVYSSAKSILLSSVFSLDLGSTTYSEFILDIIENIIVEEPLMPHDDLLFFGLTSSTLASFHQSDNKLPVSATLLAHSFGIDE